jgi:hypothetical protein
VATAALRDYFGETAFSFSLEEAIGVVLTPYAGPFGQYTEID